MSTYIYFDNSEVALMFKELQLHTTYHNIPYTHDIPQHTIYTLHTTTYHIHTTYHNIPYTHYIPQHYHIHTTYHNIPYTHFIPQHTIYTLHTTTENIIKISSVLCSVNIFLPLVDSKTFFLVIYFLSVVKEIRGTVFL